MLVRSFAASVACSIAVLSAVIAGVMFASNAAMSESGNCDIPGVSRRYWSYAGVNPISASTTRDPSIGFHT